MEDKVVDLMIAGVPHGVIADAVGCDPSYISQLAAREDVQERVAKGRVEKAAGRIEHDDSIHELEATALGRLHQLLPLQTDVMKVARIFQIANAAKKSSDVGIAGQAAVPATIVALQLPPEATLTMKLTSEKQVVEVQGRSMVPMPSHMVAAKLREKKAAELLEHSQVNPTQALISGRTKSIVDQL